MSNFGRITWYKDAEVRCVRIIELDKEHWKDFKLHFKWTSNEFYKVDIRRTEDGWTIELRLKRSDKPIIKDYEEPLWQQWMDEESDWGTQIFGAEVDGRVVGWMTMGMESWNNRLRIHEILVLEEYRKKGIGKLLLNKAKQIARQKNCRAIVLETQTNNVGAIAFYKKQGFEFNGCDITAYRNDDIEQNEVRIDMVYRIEDGS